MLTDPDDTTQFEICTPLNVIVPEMRECRTSMGRERDIRRQLETEQMAPAKTYARMIKYGE